MQLNAFQVSLKRTSRTVKSCKFRVRQILFIDYANDQQFCENILCTQSKRMRKTFNNDKKVFCVSSKCILDLEISKIINA